ncbi:MAG: ATP-dependent helicase [Phycisphaerales bacterium]
MTESDHLLNDLTPAQREAVLCTEGPLLVLAGPGSGKTRVITRRIAHLVGPGGVGVPAWQVLAVTFTNKAAGEMKSRVAALLGEGALARGLTVTTFHSLCVRLLRRYAELWALEARDAGSTAKPPVEPGFAVFDADDQASIMKTVLSDMQLSTANWPPRMMLGAISKAKNELLDESAYARAAGDFQTRTVARVYERYDAALRRAGGVDFDDLLLLTARMLRESSAVRSEVRRRYRYLLIDEYQDTNKAQFVIANLIAGEEGQAGRTGQSSSIPRGSETPGSLNICVVGDPDQSIYGWRGADIANILQFEEHYPSARVIALGENFRSVPSIVGAADRLIRRNARRKHKTLVSMRPEGSHEGGRAGAVEIVLCRDEHHEAALVLDWLRARRESGAIEWKDAAVFYRTNALSRVIEDTLRNAGVPYTIVRGTAFYQREEVRNALAYLRVVANPSDAVSLARIINTPTRGIGQSTIDKVESAAAQQGIAMMDALRAAREVPGVPTRSLGAIARFVEMLDSWTAAAGPLPREPREPGDEVLEQGVFAGTSFAGQPDEAAAEGSLAELVERVVRESGLERMYEKEEERAENLAELVSSAREFEEELRAGGTPIDQEADMSDPDAPMTRAPLRLRDVLRAYLERVALVADTDALGADGAGGGGGSVTLMTLHAAKGLEYRAVALIGLEESILPHVRSTMSDAEEEEERRLCFVGVTRAMDQLLLTSATYRTLRGIPERMITSRFVDELRGEGVLISDQSGGSTGFEDNAGDPHVHDFVRRGDPGAARRSGPPHADPEFEVGARVRHPQFGVGTVEAFSGGSDARVRVKFRDVGVKTLVLAYARLQRA